MIPFAYTTTILEAVHLCARARDCFAVLTFAGVEVETAVSITLAIMAWFSHFVAITSIC